MRRPTLWLANVRWAMKCGRTESDSRARYPTAGGHLRKSACRLGGLGGGLFLVGRLQLERTPAHGTITSRLAEDDCNLVLQGDAVSHMRPAVLVSLDGFFHEGLEGGLAILRHFVDADHVF